MVKAWLSALALILCAGVRAASVSAVLDRMFIEAGEPVALRIVVENTRPTEVPRIPSIKNVISAQYQGPTESTQIMNGVSTYQLTLRFLLQTGGSGELVIPEITVATASGPLKTAVARCWLLPFEAKTNMVSLKIATARDRYFVGETFPFELQLYSAANINQLAPPKMSFDGFVVGREAPASSTQVNREGNTFGIVSHRKAVTPTKEGMLTLGPASEEFVIAVNSGRRQRSFLEDFFGSGNLQQGVAEAAPRVIQVQPLPDAGRPGNFSGAIGSYTLTATASRTNLAVGDAVTVNFIISGHGSFDTLPSPKLAVSDGLKSYAGTNSFEAAEPLGLWGTKTFEQVVIVESAAVKSLSFEAYSFFDPETGRYTTARLAAIPVTVRDGAGSAVQSSLLTNATASAKATAPRRDDLMPLMAGTGKKVSLSEPWAASPWFAVIILGPLLAFGAAGGLRKLKHSRVCSQQPSRRSLARMSVREQQAALHEAAATGRSQKFFSALDAVLKQQIALTLGMGSGQAVTADIVDTRLVPAGLSEESADRLRRLFNATDAARFAPLAMPEELATWRQLADEAIAELQQMEVRE
jgi:hypothetical protein